MRAYDFISKLNLPREWTFIIDEACPQIRHIYDNINHQIYAIKVINDRRKGAFIRLTGKEESFPVTEKGLEDMNIYLRQLHPNPIRFIFDD